MLKATAILLAFAVWGTLGLLYQLNGVILPRAQEIVVKTGVAYTPPFTESYLVPLGRVFESFWVLFFGNLFILSLTVILLLLPKVRDTWVLLFLSILLVLLMGLAGNIGGLAVFRLVTTAVNI
jgi:hypothetical protein